MSEKGFWRLTLRQFSILTDRHKERVKREDRRAGELIAMFYNANRDVEKDRNGIDWQDVFPEWKESPPEQSEDEMMRAMELWVGATAPRNDESAKAAAN